MRKITYLLGFFKGKKEIPFLYIEEGIRKVMVFYEA